MVCFQGPILLPWDNRCAWTCVLWGCHMLSLPIFWGVLPIFFGLGWITHHNRIYSSWTWVESIWIIYREYSPINQWPGWTAVCRAKSPVLCLFAVHFCGRLSSDEQLGIGDVTMLRFISYHETDVQEGTVMEKGAYIVLTCFKWAPTAHISVYRCIKL